jgi:ribosomal protein S18 acetylase RimI-like enzyme
MPDNFSIREIISKEDPTINQVEQLFLDMYEYMQHHGLLLGLADKGEKKWMDSVLKGLGRFGVLYISTVDKEITGFAHGSIRLSPDYLGNKKLGVITHVHLKEKYRAHGAGKAMVKKLEEWFSDQDVHSIELQVLGDNIPAIGFWQKMGYRNELVQCRKMKEDL